MEGLGARYQHMLKMWEVHSFRETLGALYFLSCSSTTNSTTGDLMGWRRPEEDSLVSLFPRLLASVTPICRKDAAMWTMLTARSHPRELWRKLTNPLIGYLQLTFEQHKFDLLGSTYMRMFFNSEHSVVSDSVTPWTCSPPGSSVHGILQARILEWVAISFSIFQ